MYKNKTFVRTESLDQKIGMSGDVVSMDAGETLEKIRQIVKGSVEVKNKDTAISKNLYYFRDKLSIPYNYQIEKNCTNERIKNGVRVMPADKFLTALI